MTINTKRVNFYQTVHKMLRRTLFLFAIELARVDFTQEEEVAWIKIQFAKIKTYLAVHAQHEHEFFHPLIKQCLGKAYAMLESSHAQQDQRLAEIEDFAQKITQTADPITQQNLGVTLYLRVNRFIAEYLQHLDEEESVIMPALWEQYDDAQLMAALKNLLASMTREEYINGIMDFLPALSAREGFNLLAFL